MGSHHVVVPGPEGPAPARSTPVTRGALSWVGLGGQVGAVPRQGCLWEKGAPSPKGGESHTGSILRTREGQFQEVARDPRGCGGQAGRRPPGDGFWGASQGWWGGAARLM